MQVFHFENKIRAPHFEYDKNINKPLTWANSNVTVDRAGVVSGFSLFSTGT